ncbi:MAG: hypothetical protein K9W42_05305 [Candidatus Heimdallarchaeota archaeon]|nr:hypothetical protein [Candidatus Heimdallarchaeota archaeon]
MSSSKVFIGIEPVHFAQEGLSVEPAIWEDGRRVPLDRRHFEWWYTDAELDDGSVIVVVFGIKPFFDTHFPVAPLVAVEYRPPEGKSIQAVYQTRNYRKKAHFATDKCDIRIGENSMTGDLKHYSITVKTKKISLQLELENLLKPWRFGNGYMYFKEKDALKKFAWFPAVPLAKVTGTITVKGTKHEITGKGYHDHNWGNADPSNLFHHWYWCRGHIGKYSVIAGELVTHKRFGYSRHPYILMMTKEEIITRETAKITVERSLPIRHSRTRKLINNQLKFGYSDEKRTFDLLIERQKDLVVRNLMLFNSPHLFFHQIGKNPWYHRFYGKMTLNLEELGPAKPQKEQLESSVIYELMYFGRNYQIAP